MNAKRGLDRAAAPVARYLQHGTMERLGIRNTMRMAKWYNGLLWRRCMEVCKTHYDQNFERLLDENGGVTREPGMMTDGFFLDTSQSLPGLSELLADADQVIRERGDKSEADDRYRAFFRNLITPADLVRYPSFLNFALSSDVLATASNYLGFIPCLSATLPPGVRFVQSSKDMDAQSHLPPRDSQLFHIDPYDTPMVYVNVLLRDVTPECGPFTYISESVSQAAAARLRYWTKGRPYRMSDDEIYSVVDRSEVRQLVYPRGTVLFIDPSRCFHYGSRDAVQPRYMMMYGFVSPCRSDFTETFLDRISYPVSGSDSMLRRLVLDKFYNG